MGMVIANKEKVQEIKLKHRRRVQVLCDEYHAHTAHCLSGPEDSRDVCILGEYISILESRLARIAGLAVEGD